MQRTSKKIIILKLCLLICFCLISGFANAATITYTPLNPTVTLGDPVTLSIIGEDFTELTNGGNVDLSWDNTILTLDSISDVVITFPGNFNGKSLTDSDTIHLSLGDIFGSGPFGPDFNIADILFTATGVGISPISFGTTLTNWVVGDSSTLYSPQPTFVGGNVTVNAVPIPGALWLLGSGLIGMVGIRRKLRK
jgi:hypothetical protein